MKSGPAYSLIRSQLLKAALFLLSFTLFLSARGQTVFWTETFNNSCAGGCSVSGLNTGNGAWSVDNSALPAGECNDFYANPWYVSCKENGNAVTTCGSGCGSNATLHIGSTTLGDIGAAYDAGGFGGCGTGGTASYTRAVSPNISTIGKSGISVSFDYITYAGSTSSSDYSFIEYSTNGGTSWATLVNPIPASACCGGACNGSRQGKWTNYTSGTLPAAANNISNFKLRFVWKNDDDGIGSDPSIAINDLKVRNTGTLPIELLEFNAYYNGVNAVLLEWKTASELNNDHFTIERSANGLDFSELMTLPGAGNSTSQISYSATDPAPLPDVSYYRLKQTDFDGHYSYSPIASVEIKDQSDFLVTNIVQPDDQPYLEVAMSCSVDCAVNYELYDMFGNRVYKANTSVYGEHSGFIIPVSRLQTGIYLLKVYNGSKMIAKKIRL